MGRAERGAAGRGGGAPPGIWGVRLLRRTGGRRRRAICGRLPLTALTAGCRPWRCRISPHHHTSADDERFLVKTMRKSEARVLLGMLPAYYAHVQRHPHTLITRFFGVHRVTPAHGRAVSGRGQSGARPRTTARAARGRSCWAARPLPHAL